MIWAVIVAAGRGERLKDATDGLPKQFVLWRNEPLYVASVKTFAQCARVRGVVVVFPPEYLDEERLRLLPVAEQVGLPCRCVAGGARRQDSVRAGLQALPDDCTHVLIHDAARPFVSPTLVVRVLEALHNAPGAIPGLPVTDTIKTVQHGHITGTLDRSSLIAVQTPQGFAVDALRSAHQLAENEHWDVTDDASLLERAGYPVHLVAGDEGNIKITHRADLQNLAQSAQSSHGANAMPFDNAAHTAWPCTGYGYDVHRLIAPDEANARPMRLGGVTIPCKLALCAHSDGDVLLHALMDALLGCVACGDIGALFPDTDPAYSGINSAVLLDETLRVTRLHGLSVEHVDLTLITQTPKIAPHRDAIRRNVAQLLGLALERVNVKATTEEGLGFTGNKQGIKAVAVVTGTRRQA